MLRRTYRFTLTGKAPALQKLQKDLASLPENHRTIVRRCVIQSVDNGRHDFLFALQESYENESDIEVVVDGQNIAENSDGLHGELFTEDGWKAKYGKFGEPSDEP